MTEEKHILDQTVGDVIEKVISEPATIPQGSTLKDAIDAMVESPITRKVYIVDAENKVVGTICIPTLMRQVGYTLSVRSPGVKSFFTWLTEVFMDTADDFAEAPVTVTKNTTIVDATKLIVEHELNDLPIVDDNYVLIGELNSLEILMTARKLFGQSIDSEIGIGEFQP